MEQHGLELPLYNTPVADADRNAIQHAPATDQYKSSWQKCKAWIDMTWSNSAQSTRRWWIGVMNGETRGRIGCSRMQGALTCSNPLRRTFLTRRIVEDYPNGYPRFSALSAACPSFQICRRFRTVRSRLLLLKQDEVAELELKLDEIDRTEPRPIFLGSRRRDANAERKQVLARLDAALADYGQRQVLHSY